MKAKLVTNTMLPGAFEIEAETPEEALIIRMFCNDCRPIYIANHGGNIEENRQSMLIAHVSESQEKKQFEKQVPNSCVAFEIFDRSREALLDWINQYARCVYGSFPELDKLIDDFEKSVVAARLR